MGARRPPGGAESQRRRRRRGEWRRPRRCGVLNSRPRARAARPRRGEGAAGSGWRRGAPGARGRTSFGGSLSASGGGHGVPAPSPCPGAAIPAPASPAWRRKPPASARAAPAPGGAPASRQVSGRGDCAAGHTPSQPWPRRPRSPAPHGARIGGQGDLLRSDPQPETPASLGPRAAGPALASGRARGGLRDRGAARARVAGHLRAGGLRGFGRL